MNEFGPDDAAPAARVGSIISVNARLRSALACGVAVIVLTALVGTAEAAAPAKKPVGQKQVAKETPKPLQVPIIAVSIGSQRLTVYDKGQPVASAPVSTGTPGHPTPTGIFSVIQKHKVHFSNLYGAAPMPYMQRITWSGVAMHAGPLPGYPASHGCIRLPRDFAVKLWSLTRMGARVIVARNEVVPQEISHPRLFVLKKAPQLSRLDRLGVVVAEGDSPVVSDAVSAVAKTLSTLVKPAEAVAPVEPPATAAVAEPAKPAESEAVELPDLRTGAVKPAPIVLPAEIAAEPPPAAETPTVVEPPKLADKPLRSGPVSVFVSRKEGKLFVRKGFEPIFEMPVTIARADAAIGNHVFTASELMEDGASFRWLVVSMHASAPRASEGRRDARKPAAKPAKPAAPALLPPPATAAEALDRIEFPPEAIERIAQMMSPGASLIVSDQGLGPETGKETDFIVLTR